MVEQARPATGSAGSYQLSAGQAAHAHGGRCLRALFRWVGGGGVWSGRVAARRGGGTHNVTITSLTDECSLLLF